MAMIDFDDDSNDGGGGGVFTSTTTPTTTTTSTTTTTNAKVFLCKKTNLYPNAVSWCNFVTIIKEICSLLFPD